MKENENSAKTKRPRKANGYVPVQNHTKRPEPRRPEEPQPKIDDTPAIHRNLWK